MLELSISIVIFDFKENGKINIIKKHFEVILHIYIFIV